jgi:hypothetical protein
MSFPRAVDFLGNGAVLAFSSAIFFEDFLSALFFICELQRIDNIHVGVPRKQTISLFILFRY